MLRLCEPEPRQTRPPPQSAPAASTPAGSVELQHPVDGAQLGGLDQPRMRDRDRMKGAFELGLPEFQEAVQNWELRAQIVVLPDIGLQKARMVRHAVGYVGRGQAVTADLLDEVLRGHSVLHSPSDRV